MFAVMTVITTVVLFSVCFYSMLGSEGMIKMSKGERVIGGLLWGITCGLPIGLILAAPIMN